MAGFVLKYRLSDSFGDDAPESPYELEHSVVDTQRAIRVIRSRAAEWCYSVNNAGERYGYDADVELFMRVLQGQLPEATYPDQMGWECSAWTQM